MLSSHESYAAILHETAHFYRDMGWSVIPLVGRNNPEKAKIPAVPWREFQQRQPLPNEIDEWFLRAGYGGLGIVCGAVSGLIVLDFDDPERAKAFARCCPELTNTLTVQSGGRGLPHYYYILPDSLRVETRRIAGVDLQADGRYVVAPPTAVVNGRWTVQHDAEPYRLTPADLERIQAFFEVHDYEAQRTDSEMQTYVGEPQTAAMQQWYQRLAPRIGRNNALFKVTAYARDIGWSQVDVRACLVNTHIVQPPAGDHSLETPAQRYHEALRTINSVYRRTPRPRSARSQQPGLPNSIREQLLQRGQAAAARVLDGLLMIGIRAGEIITESITLRLLQPFAIGRRAIQAALTACGSDGQAIFVRKERTRSEGRKSKKRSKKCFLVTGANRVKIAHSQNRAGYPPRLFIMPDTAYLSRIFGVAISPGDPLTTADLRSPRHYRMALQRALFRRRPGVYSRRWLCDRLGISVWTCRRYDRDMGVNWRPTYRETVITWANIGDLRRFPAPPDGQFLEAPDGKRYPPLQRCAGYLLPQHGTIILKERSWNHYSLEAEQPACEKRHNNKGAAAVTPSPQPLQIAHAVTTQPAATDPQEPEHAFWLCPQCHNWHIRPEAPEQCDKCGGIEWQWINPYIWQDTQRCIAWWRGLRQQKRSLKPPKPGYDARIEVTAYQLQTTLRGMQPDTRLSYRRARDLVRAYGPAHVERVLRLLGRRRNVHNPTGFVIAVLRKENRYAEPEQVQPTETQVPEPQPQGDAWAETAGMRALRESAYVGFYANAHLILRNDNAAGEGDVAR